MAESIQKRNDLAQTPFDEVDGHWPGGGVILVILFAPRQLPAARAAEQLFFVSTVGDDRRCWRNRGAVWAASSSPGRFYSVDEALAPGEQAIADLVNELLISDAFRVQLVEPVDCLLFYPRRPGWQDLVCLHYISAEPDSHFQR